MSIRSNSPNGYTFLAISGIKENFTDAVIVATSVYGSQYKYFEYVGGNNVTSSILFTNKTIPNVGSIVGRSISSLRPLYFPNGIFFLIFFQIYFFDIDFVYTIAIYDEVLTKELPSKFSNRTNFYLFVGSNYNQKPINSIDGPRYSLPPLDQLEIIPLA